MNFYCELSMLIVEKLVVPLGWGKNKIKHGQKTWQMAGEEDLLFDPFKAACDSINCNAGDFPAICRPMQCKKNFLCLMSMATAFMFSRNASRYFNQQQNDI